MNHESTETTQIYLHADMQIREKALAQLQARFSGAVEPDHVPRLAGDTGLRRAGTAYCIASMRPLLQRANEEAG